MTGREPLFLLFRVDGALHGIEAAAVTEVLPLVQLRPAGRARPAVAGLFLYRGTLVPAIDLAALATGTPARPRLGTRIVLVRAGPEARLAGLIAEQATEMLRIPGGAFSEAAGNDGDVLSGPVAMTGRGPVQRLDIDALLAAALRIAAVPAVAGAS